MGDASLVGLGLGAEIGDASLVGLGLGTEINESLFFQGAKAGGSSAGLGCVIGVPASGDIGVDGGLEASDGLASGA